MFFNLLIGTFMTHVNLNSKKNSKNNITRINTNANRAL